jgi:signal transduction histidine kinase
VLYQSRPPFEGSPKGTFTVTTGVTQLRAETTLHPDLVSELRASLGGSSSRVTLNAEFSGSVLRIPLPLGVLLPLVAALLAIMAGVGLWREHQLTRARRDFVASVSHELRTPLAQIRMFTETLLLRREKDEEERVRWLGVVSRESRRLGDLVENILMFSHLDADRVRIEKERTDLGELIEEVVEGYVPVAAQKGMRIVADAPSRIFSMVDPRAMRQVVVNLLDNALKYGPKGQVVTIELERIEAIARMTVTDQGPGIPAGDRLRIWEPFVRLSDRGGISGGSGIGLSVVRDLVKQHNGTISVADAPGGGARFTVDLPVSDSIEGLPMRATGEFRARELAARRAADAEIRGE